MMAGGDDADARVVKVAGAARRPSIRPKPVTPPRTAPSHRTPTWTLPPVRTPEPRIAKRPVLVLVEQDDDVAFALPPIEVAPWWRQPRAVALVVASVLAAALTTTAVVWAASARRDAAEAFEAVGTTTLASASLSVSAPAAVSTEAKPAEPAIPVVDVNRLPSVPTRMATSATR